MKPLCSRAVLRVWSGVLTVSVLAATGAALPAEAQTCPLAPGCRATFAQTVPFATQGQSIWGPLVDGPAPESVTWWPFDGSWDESGDSRSVQSISTIFGTKKFGGSVEGEASGRVGMHFDFRGFGTGQIAVDYPVDVQVTVPEPKTYRPGDLVEITTGWSLGDGADIDVTSTEMGIDLKGVFRMRNAAGFEICFFDCAPKTPFFPTIDIPESHFTLLTTSPDLISFGGEDIHDLADRLGVDLPEAPGGGGAVLGSAFTKFTGVGGTLARPAALDNATLSTSGATLQASGRQDFIALDVDLDKFLQFIKVIPPAPPLGANLELADYGAFDLSYDILDLDAGFSITDIETMKFRGTVKVRVDFGGSFYYHVTDGNGDITAQGTGTSVTFPVGHTLSVQAPDDESIAHLSPVFSLENNFQRYAGLKFHGDMQHRNLRIDFEMARHDFTYERDEKRWKDVWHSCSEILDAGDAGEFFSYLWDCTTGAISGVWEEVSYWVTVAYDYLANNVALHEGPLYETTVANGSETLTIFDTDWALDGFGTVPGAQGWTLDPENPSVDVSAAWSYAFPGSFVQTIQVRNLGDVPLNAASVLDALDVPGLTVADIESFDVTVNPGFDGLGDAESLAGGQVLPVGGEATVTIRWTPTPGSYHVGVTAEGTSPIGTVVVADGGSHGLGWSVLDIQPDSLNRKAGGTLPVHVYGVPGLTGGDVALASVRLEGVAPEKAKVVDLNLDGIQDLLLHFEQAPVLAGLDARMAEAAAMAVLAAQVAQPVMKVVFAPFDVARLLLTASGTSDERLAMDRAGNGNGRLDVGDLRAAALAGGQITAQAKGGNAFGAGAPPEDFTLVLTGNLGDGTPFWAEDHAVVRGDAR